MEQIIIIDDLHHHYDNAYHALRGINIVIHTGEFVAIMGQNGSGKTTFVKHLNGLLRATSGRVLVNGVDVANSKVSEMAKSVGFCFQNPDHQIFCESVYEEVAYGPRNLSLTKREIDNRVQEAIYAVGLESVINDDPKCLSKGQRQRVAVASILSMKTKILIIDEPTTGQDYRNGLEILELMKRLNEIGHTVLFISHDVNMVARFAKRVIIFRNGQVFRDGLTRMVLRNAVDLRSCSLEPPQITSIADGLSDLFPNGVASTPELVSEVLALLNSKTKKGRYA